MDLFRILLIYLDELLSFPLNDLEVFVTDVDSVLPKNRRNVCRNDHPTLFRIHFIFSTEEMTKVIVLLRS